MSVTSLICLNERKRRSKEKEDEICVKKKKKKEKEKILFLQYVRHTVFYLFVYAALLSSGRIYFETRKSCLCEVQK